MTATMVKEQPKAKKPTARTLLEAVEEAWQNREAVTHPQYCELLQRDDPKDAAAVCQAATDLGKSMIDVRRDFDIIRQVKAIPILESEIETLTAETDKLGAESVRWDFRSFDAPQERIDGEAYRAAKTAELGAASRRISRLRDERGLLRQVATKHWELCGGEPPTPEPVVDPFGPQAARPINL